MAGRNQNTAYAIAFAACLPQLQNVAREHGYALGVHGSMSTDLDLIAAPWVETASDPSVLIEAIRSSIGGYIRDESKWDHNPSLRPHGRLAWSIYPTEDAANMPGVGPYLDVSVMPTLRTV